MTLRSMIGRHFSHRARVRFKVFQAALDFARSGGTIADRECNVCGYHGPFYPFGIHLRRDVGCPVCHSYERHRLFKLWFDSNGQWLSGKTILHFAPEQSLKSFIEPIALTYTTADIATQGVDLKLDIENISIADRFDVIIASHVLEHVDDHKALRSVHSTLRSGGHLIAMVPMYTLEETFEDPTITAPKQRELYFDRYDHVRLYGADFKNRIESAGFSIDRYFAREPDVSKHGLFHGDSVFVCKKLT